MLVIMMNAYFSCQLHMTNYLVDTWVDEIPMIKSRNGFLGITCIKMYRIDVGFAQPASREKMPHSKAKVPIRQYNVGYPMERIGRDICCPYPVSKKGHRYLMVVSCYFTKWEDAIPLKTKEAKYSSI